MRLKYTDKGGTAAEMDLDRDEKLRQLYLEMFDPLLSYAYGVLRNHALAEEAVQDTFRIACIKSELLFGSENPQGWLTNTLKYVLSNMKRNHARLNALMLELMRSSRWAGEDPCNEINPDILYSDLSGEEDYRLLKQIVLEQKTILETAEELGISVEACKKRIQREKKTLRRNLLE